MTLVTRFFRFWYDFIVGDDWTVAAAVVAALVVTAFLGRHRVAAWWVLPVVVVLTLGLSLRRSLGRRGS